MRFYSIAASKRNVCYLQQQHEEGIQQHDDQEERKVLNFKFFCQGVACFIVVFLKETILLLKYRKETITPQK
jgi:hypothetical protein